MFLWSNRVLLALLLTTAASAQMASTTQNMRRVGARLACQCGCPDTVASCSMLGCSFSHPAKEKIAQMQASGVPDSSIIDDFIKAYGKGIYRSEPNAFGWLVPYRSEEHTSELQSPCNLVCRLLLEKKKKDVTEG